jgi:two-component system response regulator HydG
VTPEVLIVDNDAQMATMVADHLRNHGLGATAVTSGAEAVATLDRQPFAVIVTDLVMDAVDGLDVLRHAQKAQPGARVILMTAFGTMESAIAGIRDGAYDYLTKPFRMAQVMVAVQRALDDHRLRDENRRLRTELRRHDGFEHLLGVSEPMQALKQQITDVAGSDATLLLVGESGTGKELVARAVHAKSRRSEAPFVAVNCAAIPESLLESELFGHEKGAFTGAVQSRRGLFAEANGGTLFLDEIADMPLSLQAKLLRALQDRHIRPVGGRAEIAVDVRFISATNRDLARLVELNRFREDLYYRLAVIPIRLPSLRERPGDAALLARHFADQTARRGGKPIDGISEDALEWLQRQRWPGNVRQLENVIERAVTLAQGPIVTLADVQPDFAGAPATADGGVRPTLAELEYEYTQRVLEETKGDKHAAARILGVSVRTLQRKTPAYPSCR